MKFLLIVLAALVADSLAFDVTDATPHCFSVQDRRNQKDLYADSADCHNYIQCFYMNETNAVGFRRRCPEGLWHLCEIVI